MESDSVVMARCKDLSAAAMQRAADVAAAQPSAGFDEERLQAFSPKARAFMLAVLNRLPDSAPIGGMTPASSRRK